MFAKIFSQIFDSSIVEDPELRFTFMDLLILCDAGGVVDMTHESIARRTNRSVEVIRRTIAALEAPDTRSRTPDHNGARLVRLDAHRDWGWQIVNYTTYRQIASDEQRREKTAERTRRWRDRNEACDAPVTPCDAVVTHGDACDAMQKQKQKECRESIARAHACDLETELPPGFPKTEEEAKAHAGIVGCSVDFAGETWNKAMSRGGTDAKGRLIRSWRHYLAIESKYDRNRTEEKKRNENSRTSNVSRNAGSYNEGYDIEAAKRKVL